MVIYRLSSWSLEWIIRVPVLDFETLVEIVLIRNIDIHVLWVSQSVRGCSLQLWMLLVDRLVLS